MNRGQVLKAAHECGLLVREWKPGDGLTRYRFFEPNGPESARLDFHSGGELYTALGAGEACTWLTGFRAGLGSGLRTVLRRDV